MNESIREVEIGEGYILRSNGELLGKFGRPLRHRKRNNYVEVTMKVGTKNKRYNLSRLLYNHFISEFDLDNKNLCIVYKDGNGYNVSLDNLVLKSRKDLIQGDRHKNRAKLTDEQAEEIRKNYQKGSINQNIKIGESYKDLAERYNVSKATIAGIIKNRYRDKNNYKLK